MNALAIHNAFTVKVQNERKSMREVLFGIIHIEKTKAYAELGYSSLYSYLTIAQKYSEGSAQRRISAARLLNEMPDMEPKLQEGDINLTQLVKLSMAIKQEQKQTGVKVTTTKKKEIIERLENKNSLKTDLILQEELSFEPKIKEEITVKKDLIYLTLGLTESQYEKLKRVQGILSHIEHEGSLPKLLDYLTDKVIAHYEGKKQKTSSKPRKDKQESDTNKIDITTVKPTNKMTPANSIKESGKNTTATMAVEKIKSNTTARAVTDSNTNSTATVAVNGVHSQSEVIKENAPVKDEISGAPTATAAVKRSTTIKPKVKRIFRILVPRDLRRYIFYRAEHCCQYVSEITGKRCGSHYQLQIDHIIPVAKGGTNVIENLRMLCRTHNLSEARRWGLLQ